MPSVTDIPPIPRGKAMWSTGRKLMGNLIPALIGIPLLAIGLRVMQNTLAVFGAGLIWMGCGVVAMWLAVNFVGLFANSQMRRELGTRLRDRRIGSLAGARFVGCATPTYAGWLDPHEDVGFLRLESDRLLFLGDRLELVMMKKDVTVVCFRPNVHTLVGLGRWIAVEGIAEGKRVRMLLEPRERPTLLGNLLFSKKLRSEIDHWLKEQKAQA
jgi:hypothetical protein